jgi:hypothetical protein
MIKKECILLIIILFLTNCSREKENNFIKDNFNYVDELEENKICLDASYTTYQDYLTKEELEEYENINIEEWINQENKIGEWFYYKEDSYFWICYIESREN